MAKELDAMVAGPTAEQLSSLRSKFSGFLEENGRSDFDQRDIQRLMFDDDAITRYFKHVWEMSGDQIENALKLIVGSLAWRKRVGILDLRSSDLSSDILASGVLYLHNRDRDNRRLLILDVKKYDKTKLKVDDVKQLLHYLAHRVEREENYDKVSIVFDCVGSGLRNLDLETTTYIINYFKLYSPWSLHNILVLEMPWVLNATWNVMKALMPASAVRKTKFIKRQQLVDYIDPDQIMVQWGGTDPWTYSFEPEAPESSKDSLPTPTDGEADSQSSSRSSPVDNGISNDVDSGIVVENMGNGNVINVEEGDNIKAENKADKVKRTTDDVIKRGDVVIEETVSSLSVGGGQARRRRPSSRPNLLQLTPDHELVFGVGDHRGDLVARIEVKNVSNSLVAFKVKTTSPDKFTVRPSMASLAVNQVVEVEIHVPLTVAQNEQSSIEMDKFLFSCIKLDKPIDEGMTKQAILELLKTRKADKQYRLRCKAPSSNTSNGQDDERTENHLHDEANNGDKVLDAILRKLSTAVDRTEALESELRFLKRTVILILIFTFLVFLSSISFDRFYNVQSPTLDAVVESCSKMDEDEEILTNSFLTDEAQNHTKL